MELTLSSIITIIVVIAVISLIIKYIIGPAAKIITGILTILLLIYILQNFFGIDVAGYIPYGEWLNFDTWISLVKNFIITKMFGN